MLVQQNNTSTIYFNKEFSVQSPLPNKISSSYEKENEKESNISFVRKSSTTNISQKIQRQTSGDYNSSVEMQNENGKRNRSNSNSVGSNRYGNEKQRKYMDRSDNDNEKNWSGVKSKYTNNGDDISSDDSQVLLNREKERERGRYGEREYGRERGGERGDEKGMRGYSISKNDKNQGNEREEVDEKEEECSIEVWAMSMIGEKQR